MSRPDFKTHIDELSTIVAHSLSGMRALHEVRAELDHRHTRAAMTPRQRVDAALDPLRPAHGGDQP